MTDARHSFFRNYHYENWPPREPYCMKAVHEQVAEHLRDGLVYHKLERNTNFWFRWRLFAFVADRASEQI